MNLRDRIDQYILELHSRYKKYTEEYEELENDESYNNDEDEYHTLTELEAKANILLGVSSNLAKIFIETK